MRVFGIRFYALLPLAQMVIAGALLWWSEIFRALTHFHDMPGPDRAFALCISINAPVFLLRALWFRHLSGWHDHALLIVVIGLLWFWVALNITSWQRRKAVRTFSWKPLRLAGDLLPTAVGALLGFVFVMNFPEVVRGIKYSRDFTEALWLASEPALFLAWSIALVFFFGRDLIHCVSPTKSGDIELRPQTK
jgi:hypothetical protein